MTYYAHEAFPWADLDPGLTLSGLCAHRWDRERVAWSAVLGGTDQQLGEALARIIPPHGKVFDRSDAEHDSMHRAWCMTLDGADFEHYCGEIGKHGNVKHVQPPIGFGMFSDGWEAAKKYKSGEW